MSGQKNRGRPYIVPHEQPLEGTKGVQELKISCTNRSNIEIGGSESTWAMRSSIAESPKSLFRHFKQPAEDGCLSIDVFLSLFRIEREQLTTNTIDKMNAVISSLERRRYSPDQLIVQQGDPAAPNEMLIFVSGKVKVLTNLHPLKTPPSEVVGTEETANRPADHAATLNECEVIVLCAPFFIGEERVLRGSWSTATYKAEKPGCTCFVLNEDSIVSLMMTGGFDLERTLRLRAFERTLAKHGLHVSILRDALFVDHFMKYLVRHYAAENLRFLVDLIRFKHDVGPKDPFEVVYSQFLMIWVAYITPWDDMSNVCAIECPVDIVEQVKKAKERTCDAKSATGLASILDPVAKRVKRFIESNNLPAFVKSSNYSVFLKERFPYVEKNKDSISCSLHWVRSTKNMKSFIGADADAHFPIEHCSSDPKAAPIRSRQWLANPLSSATPMRATANHHSIGQGQTAMHPTAWNMRGTSKTLTGLSARPALQIKLANMAHDLLEIERDVGDYAKVRRRSSRYDFIRRTFADGYSFASTQAAFDDQRFVHPATTHSPHETASKRSSLSSVTSQPAQYEKGKAACVLS